MSYVSYEYVSKSKDWRGEGRAVPQTPKPYSSHMSHVVGS